MKKKIGVIIQTRMGSTRLPGKVLKKLNEKNTVLDILIKRLKLCEKVNEIIIATTPDKKNNAILKLVQLLDVNSFIGSEKNVLKRYYKAAKYFNLDIIIRATSDNPFIDYRVVDDLIECYKNSSYDYISNNHSFTNFPIGSDIEIFSFDILRKVYSLARTKVEKEHVTTYITRHPEIFRIYYYNLDNLKKIENLRLTIDEEDDLKMCREVYKRLDNIGKSIKFSIFDIIDIIS
ncbi:MAG: cytidylyltransferase domain-containing protein, partial [Promethearchaeota archaeon]